MSVITNLLSLKITNFFVRHSTNKPRTTLLKILSVSNIIYIYIYPLFGCLQYILWSIYTIKVRKYIYWILKTIFIESRTYNTNADRKILIILYTFRLMYYVLSFNISIIFCNHIYTSHTYLNDEKIFFLL